VLAVGEARITAEAIVIAAGGRPRIPDVPGLADVGYLSSDEALRLEAQPRRLAILGGGYIAAELAHFYGALGTEVSLVHRGPRLLRAEDEAVSAAFTEVYARRFGLHLESRVRRVAAEDGGAVRLWLAGDAEGELVADALLVAVGRVPNSDRLGLAEVGIDLDPQGFVRTDPYLETAVPGVWALGDIVGRYQLKHSANLEAAYLAHNLLNPDGKVPVDYHAMPHAIFADPQVGAVGLTEQAARAAGQPYHVATYRYEDTAYGGAIEDHDGFVKVLAEPERGEILGCHILGTAAAVLIQEVANAMRHRLGVSAITQAIYVHPALGEVVQRAFGAL
jgi:dihydrolipoamide dehydrogenase